MRDETQDRLTDIPEITPPGQLFGFFVPGSWNLVCNTAPTILLLTNVTATEKRKKWKKKEKEKKASILFSTYVLTYLSSPPQSRTLSYIFCTTNLYLGGIEEEGYQPSSRTISLASFPERTALASPPNGRFILSTSSAVIVRPETKSHPTSADKADILRIFLVHSIASE